MTKKQLKQLIRECINEMGIDSKINEPFGKGNSGNPYDGRKKSVSITIHPTEFVIYFDIDGRTPEIVHVDYDIRGLSPTEKAQAEKTSDDMMTPEKNSYKAAMKACLKSMEDNDLGSDPTSYFEPSDADRTDVPLPENKKGKIVKTIPDSEYQNKWYTVLKKGKYVGDKTYVYGLWRIEHYGKNGLEEFGQLMYQDMYMYSDRKPNDTPPGV